MVDNLSIAIHTFSMRMLTVICYIYSKLCNSFAIYSFHVFIFIKIIKEIYMGIQFRFIIEYVLETKLIDNWYN